MHVSTDQERSSPRRFLKSIYETCISSIRYLFRFDRRAMARQIGLEDSNESNAILLKYISVITAQRKLSVFDIIPFTTIISGAYICVGVQRLFLHTAVSTDYSYDTATIARVTSVRDQAQTLKVHPPYGSLRWCMSLTITVFQRLESECFLMNHHVLLLPLTEFLIF
ncbi:exocyst complex component [Trichonephila clavipes]|nr:exocyst complex component [Trichonephila clavipes]